VTPYSAQKNAIGRSGVAAIDSAGRARSARTAISSASARATSEASEAARSSDSAEASCSRRTGLPPHRRQRRLSIDRKTSGPSGSQLHR
jgi:hypothetical protein